MSGTWRHCPSRLEEIHERDAFLLALLAVTWGRGHRVTTGIDCLQMPPRDAGYFTNGPRQRCKPCVSTP
jgi:hypothetical protein